MKKNIVQIILLLLLAGIIVAAQLVPHGTSRLFDMLKIGKHATIKELRDFDIVDTASIDRIFMVDKENRKVDLTRKKNNQWYVNNKDIAQKDRVNMLLETLHRMRIKSPVAQPAIENILKKMATKSTKVEVYDDQKKIKTYYIGGVTQTETGTYALLEGSSKPFIIEMPGFRGYLSSRFIADTLLWRSARFFSFSEKEIDQIHVKNGEKPRQSFQINVKARNNYELYNAKGKKATKFDTLSVRRFVKEFRNKAFAKYISGKHEGALDSVYNSKLFYQYDVTLNNNKEIELRLHRVKNYRPDNIMQTDYLHGILNKKLWVSIQTHHFGTLFRELDDFKPQF